MIKIIFLGLLVAFVTNVKSVPMRNSDGYYMLDDMLLDENQIKLFYGTDEERSGAAKIGYWVKRWPNGVIPYRYSSQIPHQDREAIEASLSIFNEEFKGCLSTRLATSSDKNYVLIGVVKGKCHAHMGMAPSNHQPQSMSLDSGCVRHHATILHEFFHAFGIFHTQQRPDRNDYITVHENNIVQSWRQWYKRLRSSETDETISGIPYDARSFMHYRGYSNTIDHSKPSITSKQGVPAYQIGTRQQVSDADKLLLRKMYNCNALPKVTCKDKNSHCKYWANQGYCQKHVRYMRPNCQKSCGLCDDFTCRDEKKHCAGWARSRYCNTYPAYMRSNCPKSCGLC